jgi:predicted nucleotidyltransferase component of viral defense system
LELAAKEEIITDWFYFAGGTALSEFYLHHRLSEDLDFFSEDEFPHEIIDNFIKSTAKKLKATFSKKTIYGHGIFILKFKDKTSLKIDFMYQPFRQLESGKRYNKLQIASLWDITIDKLYTIFGRLNARDFVDLYFCIKDVGADMDQLINALEEKYQAGFDRMSLLSRFPAVKDVSDYPKMLVPFDRKKMEEFFLKMVKEAEKEIFK